MSEAIPDWLTNILGSTAILAALGAIFRQAISDFFMHGIEHRFNKKMEDIRAEIRSNESELENISSFLTTLRIERDSLIQQKRIEAAESAFKKIRSFASLSMSVEFIKAINIDKVKEGELDPSIQEFFKMLERSLKLEEKLEKLGDMEDDLGKLYLSEDAIRNMNAYIGIVAHACMSIKAMSEGIPGLLKSGSLRAQIEEILPNSRESFDKFGESYAYYWTQYFFEETVKALRFMVNGESQSHSDIESATSLAVASRLAQLEVSQRLMKSDIPKEFLVDPGETPTV